jgi:hypothetical protein
MGFAESVQLQKLKWLLGEKNSGLLAETGSWL